MKIALRQLEGNSPGYYGLLAALAWWRRWVGPRSGPWSTTATSSPA